MVGRCIYQSLITSQKTPNFQANQWAQGLSPPFSSSLRFFPISLRLPVYCFHLSVSLSQFSYLILVFISLSSLIWFLIMILSKRPHLMIRKLSEMLVPRSRSAIKPDDYSASPRSPLDMKFPSPVNSKRYGPGGVGLGIVAALEESTIGINRYDPVCFSGRFRCPEIDLSEEEYTCVTSRDGTTKVYYSGDGFELIENGSEYDDRRRRKPVVQPPVIKRRVFRDNPTEFLNSCCLCKKRLQGKDIYMYK